ncbi:MAG: N-acetyl-1-D-myo-inositol-2-amino-2-deoxy-alpha-D-glucopyranoside deacetylase, partial [Actinomycetes bacterium]
VNKKLEALKAHATQVQDTGPFFQMAEILGPEALGVEYFRLVKGQKKSNEIETDLFSGINVK